MQKPFASGPRQKTKQNKGRKHTVQIFSTQGKYSGFFHETLSHKAVFSRQTQFFSKTSRLQTIPEE